MIDLGPGLLFVGDDCGFATLLVAAIESLNMTAGSGPFEPLTITCAGWVVNPSSFAGVLRAVVGPSLIILRIEMPGWGVVDGRFIVRSAGFTGEREFGPGVSFEIVRPGKEAITIGDASHD